MNNQTVENDDDAITTPIQSAKDWLESLANGEISSEIETQPVRNLYAIHVQNGLIQCNFIVPESLSDGDGRWHVGAIATLIDTIGACAAHTTHGNINVSVDFNISYFSSAKIKGNLSSVVVVIKKKQNDDLVAIGKQWMSVYDLTHKSKM
ncbi:hypothetical protein MKW92_002056 [Papaver armeniacum]|nr:hypothetical protein MKW92_002056 [Papaver armeniacum]